MLFLIQIETSVPPNTPAELKEKLRDGELARAFELIAAGTLRRIWRPVAKVGSCSVWDANSHEELHAAVQSHPLYPYMKLSVTPLIEHPATAAWIKEHGSMPAF